MSILRSLLGWMVEPSTERATSARHSRRMSREQAAATAQEKREKREEAARKREDKKRDADEKKTEREQKRLDRKHDMVEARQERRDREDRARAERAHNRVKKNPKASAGGLGRLDAADKRSLETAQRMSQQFHGNKDQVVELDQRERKLPRFAVVVGEAKKITYEAPTESKRAGVLWEHESGDRGDGKPRSAKAPLLLADPQNHSVFTLKNKSPMRFSSKQGIIG